MRTSSSGRLALCLLALSLPAGCRASAAPGGPARRPSRPAETHMSTREFDDVRYGRFPSSCSPRFEKDEPHGIKLAIPPSFDLSATDASGRPAKLPLCLALKFDGLFLSRFEHVFKEVKVVLVDDERGETFTCGVWRDRLYRRDPPPALPPEQLKQQIAWEYSTVDLLEFARLPARSATYKVYALLEQHRSNVATLRVEAR